MMQSEQINELAAALAKAQGAMSNASKNKVNPHFKSNYADLAAVLDAGRPALAANGLAVTQTMGFSEGAFILRTTLMHSSGQFVSTDYPLSVGRPQEMGSQQTYARRYSYAAIVGIAQDDDDANSAVAPIPNHEPAAKPTPRINDKELEGVRKLIDETGTDIAALCRYFKIRSLMEITPTLLPQITSALESKRRPQADAAE